MPKRTFQLLALLFATLIMLGAGTPATSFDKLGHQLVCQCGCGQILLDCNHVGCPVSPGMIEELKTQMGSGLPAAGVLNFFVNKYGPIVLAAPIRGGFDNVAWIVPFATLAFATLGMALLVRIWHRRHHAAASPSEFSAPSTALQDDDLRERIRRDTSLDL